MYREINVNFLPPILVLPSRSLGMFLAELPIISLILKPATYVFGEWISVPLFSLLVAGAFAATRCFVRWISLSPLFAELKHPYIFRWHAGGADDALQAQRNTSVESKSDWIICVCIMYCVSHSLTLFCYRITLRWIWFHAAESARVQRLQSHLVFIK